MSQWFNASSAKFILGFLGIITASFILAIVISNIKEGELQGSGVGEEEAVVE